MVSGAAPDTEAQGLSAHDDAPEGHDRRNGPAADELREPEDRAVAPEGDRDVERGGDARWKRRARMCRIAGGGSWAGGAVRWGAAAAVAGGGGVCVVVGGGEEPALLLGLGSEGSHVSPGRHLRAWIVVESSLSTREQRQQRVSALQGCLRAPCPRAPCPSRPRTPPAPGTPPARQTQRTRGAPRAPRAPPSGRAPRAGRRSASRRRGRCSGGRASGGGGRGSRRRRGARPSWPPRKGSERGAHALRLLPLAPPGQGRRAG